MKLLSRRHWVTAATVIVSFVLAASSMAQTPDEDAWSKAAAAANVAALRAYLKALPPRTPRRRRCGSSI
jgi:hypothetical protein